MQRDQELIDAHDQWCKRKEKFLADILFDFFKSTQHDKTIFIALNCINELRIVDNLTDGNYLSFADNKIDCYMKNIDITLRCLIREHDFYDVNFRVEKNTSCNVICLELFTNIPEEN